MRLIDADALMRDIEHYHLSDGKFQHWVEVQPTIEECKRGEWVRHDEIKNVYGGIYIECSKCGEKYVVQHIEDEKFCRNCGADMRGDGDA